MAESDGEPPPIDWLFDQDDANEQAQASTADDATTPIAKFRPIKGRITFEDLPGELRNKIYDLSGSLRYWETQQVSGIRRTVRGDRKSLWSAQLTHAAGCIRLAARHNCRAAYLLVNGRKLDRGACYLSPSVCHEATVSQPALTRVSKQVRLDTLSIFYGDHPFVAKLEGDGARLLEWLDTIGPASAAQIRTLYLIYT